MRALSSVGRASALQAECRRFDPVSAHQIFCDAAVVQLVRIPACHAGGRGFEPRPLRHFSFPDVKNVFKSSRLRSSLSCILKLRCYFLFRALSSVGRASALQAECRRFDPVSAHHIFSYSFILYFLRIAIKSPSIFL